MFTQARYLVYRTMFLNHLVHHRAQLGVSFRLNGIAVPAVYNDSADEQGGMFMESQSVAAGAR